MTFTKLQLISLVQEATRIIISEKLEDTHEPVSSYVDEADVLFALQQMGVIDYGN